MSNEYEPGTRVKDTRSRKTGTITEGIWGGYVTVKWDHRDKQETGVHIADIKIMPSYANPIPDWR